MNQLLFKRKNLLVLSSYFLFLLGSISIAFAQNQPISGKVLSTPDNQPLIGARVIVKGETIGALTDQKGEFELRLPNDATALIVSYLGMNDLEVELDGSSEYLITMTPANLATDEVIITALGVEREEKALGYSVQKLNSEQVSLVKPVNVTNALAGKVAGVYITGNSSGPTASSNINIRGASSLLGNNQPLFVVNGMPITNDLYSFDDGLNGSTTIDFGNAAQILSPDDIESINILKGPAASALYGSRAANGVILVETKTGKKAQGVGIQINSTTNFESVLRLPKYQNEFGFGGGGKYSYLDGSNYIGNFEYYEAYGENWGPRLNGQNIKQFNSNGEAVPFVPAENNIRDFFRTGLTSINNVSINSSNETSDARFSYTNTSRRGIVPNTDLMRNTLQASIGKSVLDDKIQIRINAMYVNSGSNNVPNAGYDESSSIMYGWLWYPRQVALDELQDYWVPGQEGVQQRYVENLWVNNPWLIVNENTNSFQSNRLIGNLRVNYQITPRFSVRFRYGADVLDEQRQYRRAPSTKGVLQGSYREDEISFSETNAELLVGYSTDRTNGSPFDIDIKVGGNVMRQDANFLVANNPQLKFFGTDASIYTLTNAQSNVLVESQKTLVGINSLFAVGTISYKDYLYLDATYRQDWNSTLVNPAVGLEGSEYSFGYPSVSVSAILSEMLNISASSAITFLKLKANYAEVGNGAPAYAFGRTFTPQAAFGGNSVFTTGRTVADPNLTNERTRAFEFGTDIHLFSNRLRFDLTYYDMLSFNQVINLPVATASGYDFQITNGGEISNRGIELLISGKPIQNSNFSWEVILNLGHNRAIVESLPDVIESGRYSIIADVFPGDEGGADLEFVAEEGQLLGQLYGLGFVRDPETNQIIHENGLPLISDEKVSAGSYQPDLRAGIYNIFNFGNFNFGFLFDGQLGGNIYVRSHALYNTGGTITNEDDPLLPIRTTDGRKTYSVSYDGQGNPIYTPDPDVNIVTYAEDGTPTYTPDPTGEGGVVAPGLMYDDNGNLVPNDVPVAPGGVGYTGYFYTYYGNGFNRDNIEAATYDASYMKLREVTFGYTLPTSVLANTGLASLRVSFVGRNLLLFTQVPSIDPETYSIRNGLFVPGFESTQLPSTRSYGININVGF